MFQGIDLCDIQIFGLQIDDVDVREGRKICGSTSNRLHDVRYIAADERKLVFWMNFAVAAWLGTGFVEAKFLNVCMEAGMIRFGDIRWDDLWFCLFLCVRYRCGFNLNECILVLKRVVVQNL